jgi:hypothetical protein
VIVTVFLGKKGYHSIQLDEKGVAKILTFYFLTYSVFCHSGRQMGKNGKKKKSLDS